MRAPTISWKNRPADVIRDLDVHAADVGALPRTDASTALLAVAALTLGFALQISFGQYHPTALLWLTVSLAATAVAAAGAGTRLRRLRGAAWPLILAAIALQFAQLLPASVNPLATFQPASPADLIPFRLGVLVAGIATLAALVGRSTLARAAVPLMLGTHFLLGLWTLSAAPQPAVDVCVFQRDACNAVLNGANPYAITFPDPYGPGSPFYGSGLSQGGRLQFGYPYPPLPLLMALPGHLLGDFRLAQLAAMTLAGALIAYTRPGRLAVAAAVLLLFTPRGLFVLEAGWIEPFAALLLAAVVFVACRADDRRRHVAPIAEPFPSYPQDVTSPTGPVASAAGGSLGASETAYALLLGVLLGLLIAVKQYLVLALPVLWLLPDVANPARRWRVIGAALATGAIVSLPLALWDLPAFLHSVVTLQFHQPFRTDALSYLVPLANHTGLQPPIWLAFVAVITVGCWAARKLPGTPAGFAVGLSLVFLVFFALGKQAFCNYYYFVIAGLCCAMAATRCGNRAKTVIQQ